MQFGDGLQTRDFTFVADAVKATAAAAVRGVPGRVYNIGGGSRVSLREVFDLIARVSGRKVTIDQQGPQKGDMRDTYADTTRARADLGFAPSVTLEEGLRAMWRWMEATKHDCGFRIEWIADRWRWCWRALRRRLRRRRRNALPPGTADADKFLFDRGTEAAKDRKWLDAREYFRNLVDNYPQSPYPARREAGARRHLHQRRHAPRSLLLAANEFREFLTFYPTHPRADYAQLQLARSFTEQMLAPERDQTATRDAIKEIEIFLQRFPNSKLMPEARKMEREARDRLSEASYRVGLLLLPREVVPRRDRSLQGRARRPTRRSPTATRSTTIWRNRSIADRVPKQAGRSAPLLRTACSRNSRK